MHPFITDVVIFAQSQTQSWHTFVVHKSHALDLVVAVNHAAHDGQHIFDTHKIDGRNALHGVAFSVVLEIVFEVVVRLPDEACEHILFIGIGRHNACADSRNLGQHFKRIPTQSTGFYKEVL